jgi:pimeloyl-ACP methyl ester carboxylesterase
MDVNLSSLDVAGYKNQPVPNTFIAQPNRANHLGVILPGYHYSPDMPPLHYAGRLLLDQGADVLQIEYAYYRTDFSKQPESEQDNWLSSDVFAACNAGLAQRAYEKITLVGKSLGTIAMGHLLADPRFPTAACVWLTPLLTVEWLRARIEQIHPRSFFVIGTADPFYKPEILSHLEQVTNGSSLVIEGANHALEIPGDISKSLTMLNQIVQAVDEFLLKGTENS